MVCDYGFRAGAGRLYQDRYGEVPGGILDMVGARLGREGGSCRRAAARRVIVVRATGLQPPVAVQLGVGGSGPELHAPATAP
jgi:hypothetical protein